MSSLTVKNNRVEIVLSADKVKLSAEAQLILNAFNASDCSYDDEAIVSEACHPRHLFYPSGGGFSDHFEPERLAIEKGKTDYYNEVTKIQSDGEFLMRFKTRFMNANNQERNSIAQHASRLWSDHTLMKLEGNLDRLENLKIQKIKFNNHKGILVLVGAVLLTALFII